MTAASAVPSCSSEVKEVKVAVMWIAPCTSACMAVPWQRPWLDLMGRSQRAARCQVACAPARQDAVQADTRKRLQSSSVCLRQVLAKVPIAESKLGRKWLKGVWLGKLERLFT